MGSYLLSFLFARKTSQNALESVQIEDFTIDLPDELPPIPKKDKKPSTQVSFKKKPRMEQMYLDLGQKNFSPITCEECGMLYTPGHPQEEAAHNQHHSGYGNLSFRVLMRSVITSRVGKTREL